MAWRLEIHHIDVIGTGDATLIVAQEVAPLIGAVPIVRSLLVDGGLGIFAPSLDAYVAARLGAGQQLNAMICTHYDGDHVRGLTGLLLTQNRYDNTIIYDQGWPQVQDNDYLNFLRAINGSNVNGPVLGVAGVVARTRVTARVQADGVAVGALPAGIGAPAVPAGGLGAINRVPHWLLTGAAPADPLWNGWGAAPAGAPTMRFIAANRYVRTAAGGIVGPVGPAGAGARLKNVKSLAVEVTFGNFRYYVAGDIETPQENQIQLLLNNANNAAGRVLAFKTSHHGANTATSRAFVDQLRPDAAVLSCGTGNPHNHPAQQTINVLDGYPAFPGAHGPVPPPPPNRPVDNYLTGYQLAGPPPLSYGGDVSITAGDPNAGPPPIFGDIVMTVSNAQSGAAVEGGVYNAARIAANGALTTLGVAGVMAAAAAGLVADAAGEAALSSGSGTTANVVVVQAGQPAGAGIAADLAANGALPAGDPASVMAAAVAAAALGAGATAAVAAGAGAAAGAYHGGSTRTAVRRAVRSALGAVGMGAPAAAARGTAVGLLMPAPSPSQFRVRFYDLGNPAGPGASVIAHR